MRGVLSVSEVQGIKAFVKPDCNVAEDKIELEPWGGNESECRGISVTV